MGRRWDLGRVIWTIVGVLVVMAVAPAVLVELIRAVAPALAVVALVGGLVAVFAALLSWHSRRRMRSGSDPWGHLR